jgi:hypothetical protein
MELKAGKKHGCCWFGIQTAHQMSVNYREGILHGRFLGWYNNGSVIYDMTLNNGPMPATACWTMTTAAPAARPTIAKEKDQIMIKAANKAVNQADFMLMKQQGKKIAMITAYDYATAKCVAATEMDIILVGDSLGMVVLGYADTLQVTMEDIISHSAAVRRGAPEAFIIADMPYLSYHLGMKPPRPMLQPDSKRQSKCGEVGRWFCFPAGCDPCHRGY